MRIDGTNLGLLILRVTFSLTMLMHGFGKLINGLDGIKSILASAGLPTFFAYGALVGEIIAPAMILFGLRTRIGALILAFNMLVAIFTAHADQIFSIGPTGGLVIELPALYLFFAVALLFTGGGKFSVSTKSRFD